MQNNDFMAFYDKLLELYEAKNKQKQTKLSDKLTGPTFSDHIESFCTPMSDIVPGMPKEQSGFLLYVTPKFINHYSAISAAHPENEVEKLLSAMKRGITFLQKNGKILHKDLGTENIQDACFCDAVWRLNRISGTPIRAHTIIAHDSQTGKKYFILATLFLHRDKKLTNSEVTLGNTEYDRIFGYFGNRYKKLG